MRVQEPDIADRIVRHPDRERLAARLAERLARRCRAHLEQRGAGSLALAGGQTPMPVYAHLAGYALPWDKVSIVPSDERWVGHRHPACNLRRIEDAFAGANPALLPLTPEQPAPGSAPGCGAALRSLARIRRPFSAVVLGMGADGHFASLFPGCRELDTGLDPGAGDEVLAVRPDPLPDNAPYARITLSLAALLDTECLVLVISGPEKLETLWSAASRAADPRRCPVAALLHTAGQKLEIHWSP